MVMVLLQKKGFSPILDAHMIANMPLLLYIALGLILILIIGWVRTEMRLKKLFRGKKASDLEMVMMNLAHEIDLLRQNASRTNADIITIDARLRKSIRGIETMRFNPFKDQGSNQSFAISMINEDGDGVVLSSLYSRDHVSVFAKPVKGHKSEYDLTEEETAVLHKSAGK